MHFHCDVNIDPFVYLQENNKTYGLSFPVYFLPDTPNSIPYSGFTISLYEYQRTIESLWSTVHGIYTCPSHYHLTLTKSLAHPRLPLSSCAEFMAEHPEYVAQNNAMSFLSDNGGSSYNLCHCTSFFLPESN